MCKGAVTTSAAPQEAGVGVRALGCGALLYTVWAWWRYMVVPNGVEAPHPHWVPAAFVGGYLLVCGAFLSMGEKAVKNVWSGLGVDPKSALRETMILYNVLQVFINGWTVYEVGRHLVSGALPVVDTTAPLTMSPVAGFALWVHYCDKYLEFLDTGFMLLRGNFKQVSFLHVYHHGTIAFAWHAACWLCWKGDAYFGVLLNSIIHVLMYGYYGLTLMGVKCPWKRYLTQMQLLQFASVIVFTFVCLYFRFTNSAHDEGFYICSVIQIFEMASLFVLFRAFYKKAYKKGADRTATAAKAVKQA